MEIIGDLIVKNEVHGYGINWKHAGSEADLSIHAPSPI